MLLLFMAGMVCAQSVIYVDNSVPAGDGTSWEEPLPSLDMAFAKAHPEQEIWIRKGVYPMTNSLLMRAPLRIYGGFSGSETAVTERVNITSLNATILQFDANSNGGVTVIGDGEGRGGGSVIDGIQMLEKGSALSVHDIDDGILFKFWVIADKCAARPLL